MATLPAPTRPIAIPRTSYNNYYTPAYSSGHTIRPTRLTRRTTATHRTDSGYGSSLYGRGYYGGTNFYL